MAAHRFKLGQVVVAHASLFGVPLPGPYEVTRLLPPTGMSNRYRVRSLKNGHERIVHEDDILRTDH